MKKVKDAHLGKSRIQKSRALLIAAAFVLILVLLWLSTTLVPALVIGNGVDKFSGKKKEIAEALLQSQSYILGSPKRWAYYLHVDDVRPTTDLEKQKYCKVEEEPGSTGIMYFNYDGRVHQFMGQPSDFSSSNPNSGYYYTITLSVRPIFGYATQTAIFDGCRQLLKDGGGDGLRPGTSLNL